MSGGEARVRRFEEIAEGETALLERDISAGDVAAFARLTGDVNPLHMDEAYAAGTRFGQRVAHGMLTASLMSTLIGMELPGRNALFLSESAEFRKPVLLGDRLRMEAKVLRKIASSRILELGFTALNQRGETVMTGVARVMVMA